MNNINKDDSAYRTIGEIAKELDLIDKKTGIIQTHTLRYWESQFRQIKPTIRAGKRRYYTNKDFKIIKYVKFLLKEKGLTINGVKKILNNKNTQLLDEDINLGVYKRDLKSSKIIKRKIENI